MKNTPQVHSIFVRQIDRLIEMQPGEIIAFPFDYYWRVNALRTRAQAETGGKYSLRCKGDQVFVLRVL